jgi:uncharacterized membrane protein YhaH (DUF805 family)
MKKIIPADFCIFFLSFSVLDFMIFLAGNFRGYIARSQFLLLNILRISCFLCLLSGFAYLVYLIRAALKKSPPPGPRDFVLAGLSLGFGGLFLFVSHFIIVITLPV